MVGAGGEGYSTKLYTGRLCPEVRLLTLLYTIFDRRGTSFTYLGAKPTSRVLNRVFQSRNPDPKFPAIP